MTAILTLVDLSFVLKAAVWKSAKCVRRTFAMAGYQLEKILLSEHRTSEPMIGHVWCLPESDSYLSRSCEGLYGKTHHHVQTPWHMCM